MDADTLRIVLLILGVLLVAGIYLHDRLQNRAQKPGAEPRRRERKTPVISSVDEPPPPDPAPYTAAEATGTAVSAPSESEASRTVGDTSEPLETPEPPPGGENWQLPLEDDPQISSELNFSAHEGTDYLHQVEDVDDLPKMILQINIVPRHGGFDGEKLALACHEAGLVPGELDIFHSFDQRRRDMVVFSLANMVEPGSFPMEDLAGFIIPGVTLFTQLPGVVDGVTAYTRMVDAAQLLAGRLDAELQDDSGSTMNRQFIERTKESIVDFQRELALARRRA